MRNIVLAGFMGVGKTTVGKRLAEKLRMKFVDMDDTIEKEEGKTISEIFDKNGEEYFRNKESELFKRLINEKSLVISTGGGTFENKPLRDMSKEKAVSVCLVCSFDSLMRRIEDLRASRPKLKNKSVDEIRELYKIRAECYLWCDECINIDGITPDQVVEKILKSLKGKNSA